MKKNTLLALLTLFASSASFARSSPPNILFMVADDLSWSDIEPYGSQQVKTPNMARLAKQGMCFDNMYTATAMCSPTRQQLFTGIYPVRNGAYPNHSIVYPGTKSMFSYFNEMGYESALIGKKHIGPDESFPFKDLGGKSNDNGKGKHMPLENAEAFIQKTKKPFLLTVTFNEPHVPWNRGNPKQYPPDDIKVPGGYANTPAIRQALSKYFAEITYLDSMVGVCLDMLEKNGKAENTIVIFTTEHGSQLPFSKWTCYDRGLKTGFIIRYPGMVKPNTRNDVLTQYVDVVPTLVELAGGKPTETATGNKSITGKTAFDGISFAAVLKGNNKEIRPYAYGVQTSRGILNGPEAYPVRSVRTKEYLYIRNLEPDNTFSSILTKGQLFASWLEKGTPTDKQRAEFYRNRPAEELYDVKNDPFLLNNLAAEVSLAGKKKELAAALAAFMKEQGDEGTPTEMKAESRQPRHSEEEEG